MSKRYSILIQDLTADEARQLINEVDGSGFFGSLTKPAKFVPANTGDAQSEAPQPVATSNVNLEGFVELDAQHIPHDERIHAGSKTKNKDGTWKKRKGVQPITVTEVEKELRDAMAASAAANGHVLPPQPTVAAPQPAAVPAAIPPMPQVLPAAVPALVATPAPQPAAVPIARDYAGLLNKINQLFAAQKIAPEYPQTIVDRINKDFVVALKTITEIAANPAMVQYAWDCLAVDKLDV